MLARMVTPGNRVADVGCDHGFLSIYLVQNGISPRALAMDVRMGPLAAARVHIDECGLGAYIDTRLSDGLKECRPGEADTAVIAGMGGPLMEKILTESMERAAQLKELILQPQSELGRFRRFLKKSGFVIIDEGAVYEEEKYYFAMKAVFRECVTKGCDTGGEALQKAENDRSSGEFCKEEFGPLLLARQDPVLWQFLCFRKGVLEALSERLSAEPSERTKERLREVLGELHNIQWAQEYYREAGQQGKSE